MSSLGDMSKAEKSRFEGDEGADPATDEREGAEPATDERGVEAFEAAEDAAVRLLIERALFTSWMSTLYSGS